MTRSGRVHRGATWLLSTAMVVIGVALTVQALGGEGAGLIVRLLLGVLFIAGGMGRLYLLAHRGEHRGREAR